jgi:hypothetical protein
VHRTYKRESLLGSGKTPPRDDDAVCACRGEFGKAMQTLGLRLGKEELNLLFHEYDENGSGAIDLAEFTNLVKRSMKEDGQVLPHMNGESAKKTFTSTQSFRCAHTHTLAHTRARAHTHAHKCTHAHMHTYIFPNRRNFMYRTNSTYCDDADVHDSATISHLGAGLSLCLSFLSPQSPALKPYALTFL